MSEAQIRECLRQLKRAIDFARDVLEPTEYEAYRQQAIKMLLKASTP